MEQMERKSPLSDLMRTAMEKVHEMVDTKSIVGEPIVTADGVTLIPISRVSVGFGSGGGDYGKTGQSFGGGSGAGVTVAPVAFLVVKDGNVVEQGVHDELLAKRGAYFSLYNSQFDTYD